VQLKFALFRKKRSNRSCERRAEQSDTMEMCHQPIMKTIAATDYTGCVGQEFSPRNGAEWAENWESVEGV